MVKNVWFELKKKKSLASITFPTLWTQKQIGCFTEKNLKFLRLQFSGKNSAPIVLALNFISYEAFFDVIFWFLCLKKDGYGDFDRNIQNKGRNKPRQNIQSGNIQVWVFSDFGNFRFLCGSIRNLIDNKKIWNFKIKLKTSTYVRVLQKNFKNPIINVQDFLQTCSDTHPKLHGQTRPRLISAFFSTTDVISTFDLHISKWYRKDLLRYKNNARSNRLFCTLDNIYLFYFFLQNNNYTTINNIIIVRYIRCGR